MEHALHPLQGLRAAADRWHRLRPRSRRRTVGHLPTHLAAGSTLRLDLAAPAQLAVRQGRIWLTRPGDDADHFLGPGQGLWLEPGRAVVLESDGRQPAWLSWTDGLALREERR